MAKRGNDEHKMLFDLQGRRRNVVKVVYAILALLMAASLLLVVGPVSIGNLFSANDAVNAAADQLKEQAQRLERKAAKEPQNTDLLASLTRAQVNAGNAMAQQDPSTGAVELTPEAHQQLEKASATWDKYLKATDEPAPSLAQIMSSTFFGLAQNSRTGPEAEANLKAAAEAQQILADQRPSLNSLSVLALYRLYNFEYAEAKKVNEEAKKFANTKFQREQLENQFEEVEKNAKQFQKQLKASKNASKGAGKESLENPAGGILGGSTAPLGE